MFPNPNFNRRGSGRRRGQQQQSPPTPPSPPLPSFVPPPGVESSEHETLSPFHLLEVLSSQSSGVQRQAVDDPLQHRQELEFTQSSSHYYGPPTPSAMDQSYNYLSPGEEQREEYQRFRTSSRHFGAHPSGSRRPAVKRPYTEMSPPAEETFRFQSSLAALTSNPSTSGTGRAVHRSRSRTRRPPPIESDHRSNTYNAQISGPSGEHGIEPPLLSIPQRALPHYRFNGETGGRANFFVARAAVEEEQMEVSASPEQDDEENM